MTWINIPAAYDIFDTVKYVEYVNKTNRCWEITPAGDAMELHLCKLVFGSKITSRSACSIVKEMEDFTRLME